MRAALKWGALIGVAVYVIARVALTLLATALFGPGVPGLDNPALLSSLCLGIFLLLFAFSVAGFFAGRETGRDGTGAVAGMVAFVIYALLSQIYSPSSIPPGSAAAGTPTAAATATHLVATATATATAVATHSATATAIAHATATAAASHPAQQLPAPSGVTILLANVISFALVLGIAALMGWLGGRPGAQRARRSAARATPAE